MYGLTEASIIAFKSLVANMAPREYHPVRLTPDLWRHETLPTTFTLVVDDFGIKYFHTDQLTHFLNALRQNYRISMDLSGSDYCGLTLKWDYKKQFFNLSIPGYVEKALQKFLDPHPKHSQHTPHQWVKPNYGQKVQYASPLYPYLYLIKKV